jgi:hypothetical protein
MSVAHPGPVPHNVQRPPGPQDLQLNMRLIARFVVLMVAVFGVSLAFAWAWDKSDTPQVSVAAHTSS